VVYFALIAYACYRTGQTALNLAARHGHAEIVTLLLEAGAEPDHADVDGWTALRYDKFIFAAHIFS
jgi:hypothetical protein